METRKEMILAALDAFVRQRSGIDPCNYVTPHDRGDAFARGVQALITRDLRDYRALRLVVGLRTDITADNLVAAFRDAYGGRLSMIEQMDFGDGGDGDFEPHVKLDYCTSQYFPTEYRKAACAVLASALWARKRADMPTDTANRLKHPDFDTQYRFNGAGTWMSAGDWLRASFRKEFGRGIASRWFS